MRATFRTWVAEATSFPGELAEQALGHQVGARSAGLHAERPFERRRALMAAWSAFCARSDNVVELRA